MPFDAADTSRSLHDIQLHIEKANTFAGIEWQQMEAQEMSIATRMKTWPLVACGPHSVTTFPRCWQSWKRR